MQTLTDIRYSDAADRCQLDIYLPQTKEFDVLVYFHGGGLEAGCKADVSPIAEKLTAAGIAVVTPNYRMYPAAAYPDFLVDAAAAVAWTRQNMGRYGTVRRILVGGSSAGAYLTAMLAYAPGYLAAHGIASVDIDGYVINSAQMTTHFNILRERGLDTRRILVDEAAPVYHLTENTVWPRVLVLAADNDMPCRLEQTHMFLKTAAQLSCPGEKLQFLLMEGWRHCEYDNTDEYSHILQTFIRK